MSRSRRSISFGTILFWGFLGWMWFGDSITGFIKTDLNVKVNEKNISVNVDEIMDKAKTKFNAIKTQVEEEIIEKKKQEEEKLNSDESTMTAKETTEDSFSSDDKFGDYEERY